MTPGNGEVGMGEDKRRGGNWKEGVQKEKGDGDKKGTAHN